MKESKPMRKVDWAAGAADVDYVPATQPPSNPDLASQPTPPMREWEIRPLEGGRQESVRLSHDLIAKLKWMVPSHRQKMSSAEMQKRRERMAQAGLFDNSPHSYMTRVLEEAIERDFETVDRLYKEGL